MIIELAPVDDLSPEVKVLRAEGLAAEPLDGEWFAAREGDEVVGVARVWERDGHAMLDDVWVPASRRGSGIGTALVTYAKQRYADLWLICDEDMVDYYAARGFTVEADLPPPLAEANAAKGYWQPPDHVHIAMLAVDLTQTKSAPNRGYSPKRSK